MRHIFGVLRRILYVGMLVPQVKYDWSTPFLFEACSLLLEKEGGLIMNEMNQEKKKVVYKEQEERITIPGEEKQIRDETIFKLKDVISCLYLCDYEIHKLEKQISKTISELDN